MIVRFSLYGFLKNQRYFEPFLLLAFLDKGLDYLAIGLLISIREFTVNLAEIPSGSIADVFGRRGSMVLSMAAYLVSFLVFGFASSFGWLVVGMVLFGIGEAFRSGTHKAMIFAWLREQNRLDERTKIYGYTRSWSKYGSAVSVIIAAVLVFATESYRVVFFVSMIPYAVGMINLATYPASLEPPRPESSSLHEVLTHLRGALASSWQRIALRSLAIESMGFEGMFHAAKDYLQPLLAAVALTHLGSLAVTADLGESQRTSLLVGPVYIVLYVLAAVASRRSHTLAERAGGDEAGSYWVRWANVAVYALLFAAALGHVPPLMIGGFVALHVLQNLWRPMLISRYDTHGDERHGATLLSIESQARRLATMVLAPVVGFGVDRWGFWPIGLVGLAVALGLVAVTSNRPRVTRAAAG